MTVEGYYDGNTYITLEEVDIKPNQRVQITILDDYIEQSQHERNARLLAHFKGAGGRLWTQDPQEYVSGLRAEERIQ